MPHNLANGRIIHTLNIIDEFNREELRIEVDTSTPAACVVRVLDVLAPWRGYPIQLRLDNKPELISKTLPDMAAEHYVASAIIQPG